MLIISKPISNNFYFTQINSDSFFTNQGIFTKLASDQNKVITVRITTQSPELFVRLLCKELNQLITISNFGLAAKGQVDKKALNLICMFMLSIVAKYMA